jgi:AbrB family looped-hinge helix DNA binding protein
MGPSKLSAKSQVTLPKQVRETLGVAPGDFIVYEIADGDVRIRKMQAFDAAFHAAVSATLDEWASPEDDEAFRDL